MSEQSTSSGRFPIWIVAGTIIGVAIGAFVIFGTGSTPASDDSASATPTPSSQKPSSAQTSGASDRPLTGASAAGLPDGATLADWEKRIEETSLENYGDLMKAAIAIKDASLRDQVVQKLLLKWVNTDQTNFLEFIDDLEFSPTEGEGAWPVLVPAAAEILPSVSEEAAGQAELDEIVQWMIDYYSEMNPNAAAQWARQWLLDETRDLALATVAGAMAKTSRADALNLLQSIQNPDARLEAVMNIGTSLAEEDPDAALAWAQSLPAGEERDAAVEEVLWTMSETDPAAAAAKLSAAGNSDQLDAVSGSIAEEWAIQDAAKAISWAESLPEGAARKEAIQGALAGWAETDPKAAFAYYESNHGQNFETAEWIFDTWAFNSPADAAAAALEVQDQNMRERAIAGVVTGWLDEGSTEEVAQWVDSLPQGRQRDQAALAVVDTLSFDEPTPAWDRARTITEPDLRTQALEIAFSSLVDADPNSARSTLEAADLSEAEKAKLRPLLENNPLSTIPNRSSLPATIGQPVGNSGN